MDIEIGEVSSHITAVDMAPLKAEIIREVTRMIQEERTLRERLDRDRRVQDGALDRPAGVA